MNVSCNVPPTGLFDDVDMMLIDCVASVFCDVRYVYIGVYTVFNHTPLIMAICVHDLHSAVLCAFLRL